MPRPTAKMDGLDVDLAGAGEKPRLAHYRVAPLSCDAVNSLRDASLNGEGFASERGRRESPLGFTLRWTAGEATSRESSVINVALYWLRRLVESAALHAKDGLVAFSEERDDTGSDSPWPIFKNVVCGVAVTALGALTLGAFLTSKS
ncbi:hypothetical protein HPB47_003448 [Ixodes persulcatus]|uniref:Uncharacterized protein n=1 Tax=Ixodes persulcatus TaxID=34615 RepID=A0AC60PIV4_IXOPE|nr:hypothetical protein HPB47_003448 [Ixodes persulcatus]